MLLSPEEEAFFSSELMNKSWTLAKLLPSSPRSASLVVNETVVGVQSNITHSGIYSPNAINHLNTSCKRCSVVALLFLTLPSRFRKLIHHRKETVSRKGHSPAPQGTVMTQSSSDHHLDVARQPNGVCRTGYERHHSLPNTEFEEEDEGLYQVTTAKRFLGSSFAGVTSLVLVNKMPLQLKAQIERLCCSPGVTAV